VISGVFVKRRNLNTNLFIKVVLVDK
jgi:hypothetical protein